MTTQRMADNGDQQRSSISTLAHIIIVRKSRKARAKSVPFVSEAVGPNHCTVGREQTIKQ